MLRSDGALLVVIPTDAHLAELRRELPLLGMEDAKEERTAHRLSAGFELAARRHVE